MHKLLKLFNTNYHPKLIDALIKANFSGAILVNIFIPIIIFYLFYESIPLLHLEIWSSIQVVLFTLRLSLQKQIRAHINIQLILLSITSLLYAILSWEALLYADDVHLLLVAMIIASIVAGSIATIVSVYHIFFIFVLIQMLGLISAFLAKGEDIFFLSAFLASTFLHLVLKNGYKQYRNIKETLALNKQVKNLLDNTGDGFLSFDKNLKCHDGFSSECARIFATTEIQGKKITELLFSERSYEREIFLEAIERSLKAENSFQIEMFLSLIPQEIQVRDLVIALECKLHSDGYFILILRDITDKKRLESKLEYQHKVQKLLVNVASNKNDFIDLKNDFEQLLQLLYTPNNTSLVNLNKIKKELHTFKGNFSQKGMLYISNYIHELELKVQTLSSENEILSLYQTSELQETFHKDIAIIDNALGEEFLHAKESISVDVAAIDAIEFELTSFVYKFNLEQQIALNTILSDIHKLKNIPLKEMLTPYISYVDQLAGKLEKEILPLVIIGDETLKVSPNFKSFIKQLVHLFNNSVDHGIESIEEREETQKDPFAQIVCKYNLNSDILLLEISDDGKGIDTQKLLTRAVQNGIKTQEECESMNEDEILSLIFEERLSTKESLDFVSGVGIGLTSLYSELKKLQGNVTIKNHPGYGVKFTFFIPLYPSKNQNLFYNTNTSATSQKILATIITQSELFLKKSLGMQVSTNKKLEISDTDFYVSQIQISKAFVGKVLLVYSGELLDSISKYMLPEGFEEDEKEEIYQDVANETINTIVGLSIQYFEKSIKEVEISPPLEYSPEDLLHVIQTQSLKSIATVETANGTLGIVVIDENI